MAERESPGAESGAGAAKEAAPERNNPPLIGRLRARWDRLDTKARTAIVLVVAAVLAVGIGTVIGEVAEFDEVLSAIREASPAWLAVCLLGETLAYVGYILAFWGTSRAANGPRIPLGVMTHGVFVAFGAFAAANAAGGLATDFWMLREAGATTRSAVRRVLALNTLLYAVFGVGAFVVSILVVTDVTEVPVGMAIPWLIIVPPCVVLGIWLSSSATGRRLATRAMARTWSRLFGDAVASVILCRRMAGQPGSHKAALGGPILNWAGELICLWAALRAFGVNIPLPHLILAFAAAYVVTLMPLPAGGAGAIDASLAFGLHAVGVELAPALLATFAYRFFSYWLEIPPALVAISALPRLRRGLADVSGTHDPELDQVFSEQPSPA
ncbi:MAG: lysylphosphatidylglycerol synthase transmembrane domain-containing protein [Gaiellaceae bacterium]